MKLLYVLVAWHAMGDIKWYDLAGPWRDLSACVQAGEMYASRWHGYRSKVMCVEAKV